MFVHIIPTLLWIFYESATILLVYLLEWSLNPFTFLMLFILVCLIFVACICCTYGASQCWHSALVNFSKSLAILS